LYLTSALAFVFAVFSAFQHHVIGHTSDNRPHYGAVIDAGSTGTRLHLYRWEVHNEDENATSGSWFNLFNLFSNTPRHSEVPSSPQELLARQMTIPDNIWTQSSAGGIGTYAGREDDLAPNVIDPLIHKLTEKLLELGVKESQFSEIPVELKATAGMRDMNVDVRGRIFQIIRDLLFKTPFKFNRFDARTISGEEEGMFGWLGVNTGQGTIFNDAKGTIGALDMGGASAQVVFRPIHTSILEDSYEVNMGAESIRVYSHSYLGYGWHDAIRRVEARMGVEVILGHLAMLGWPERKTKAVTHSLAGMNLIKMIKEKGSEVELEENGHNVDSGKDIILEALNPCYPKGYDTMYEMPKLSYPDGRFYLDMDREWLLQYMLSLGLIKSNEMQEQGETIRHTNNSTAFDTNVPHRPILDADFTKGDHPAFAPLTGATEVERINFKIHWTGTGNFEVCRDRARALFTNNKCFTNTCSFNGIYQPRFEESTFHAYGQYAKLAAIMNIPSNPTLSTFEENLAVLCHMDYKTVVDHFKTKEFESYDASSAPRICWKALWAYTFLVDGLKFPDDSQLITFASYKDDNLSWATGSMINHINKFKSNIIASGAGSHVPYYAALTAAGLSLLCASMTLCDNQKLKCSNRNKNLEDDLMDSYSKAI